MIPNWSHIIVNLNFYCEGHECNITSEVTFNVKAKEVRIDRACIADTCSPTELPYFSSNAQHSMHIFYVKERLPSSVILSGSSVIPQSLYWNVAIIFSQSFDRVLLKWMKVSSDVQIRDQQTKCCNRLSWTDQVSTIQVVLSQSDEINLSLHNKFLDYEKVVLSSTHLKCVPIEHRQTQLLLNVRCNTREKVWIAFRRFNLKLVYAEEVQGHLWSYKQIKTPENFPNHSEYSSGICKHPIKTMTQYSELFRHSCKDSVSCRLSKVLHVAPRSAETLTRVAWDSPTRKR